MVSKSCGINSNRLFTDVPPPSRASTDTPALARKACTTARICAAPPPSASSASHVSKINSSWLITSWLGLGLGLGRVRVRVRVRVWVIVRARVGFRVRVRVGVRVRFRVQG